MSILDAVTRPHDGAEDPAIVQRVLQSVRQHLDMEVAYVSEFVDNDSVFRAVDAPGLEALIKPGDSRSLDDVYCRHILEGRLPQLMADTADYELAASMPITKAVPIGAHMSVPIKLSDGGVFGMFCCLSPRVNRSLNERDLNIMRAFADIAAEEIDKSRTAARAQALKRERIVDIIENKRFSIHFQPIWDFRSDMPVGFETLSRFSALPQMSPDKWFAEAASAGLGVELELAAITEALAAAAALPSDVYVTVNASAEAVMHPDFEATLAVFPSTRLVLELTEHTAVGSYKDLHSKIARFRADGMRLAIDDAGAGYSGLQQIVSLSPDIIKLDMGLTRNVDTDPARRALASALIHFARETGSIILAEGIETIAERQTLELLGITRGQGYLLGRPTTLQGALDLLAQGQKVA